jgi:Rrf2 family transcriptional regulator, iron-sulfur cluster assembly transcription factor
MSELKLVRLIFDENHALMFSKACEYAIRSVIYIAHQSDAGKRVSLKDVAREIDSPEAFTAKIMQSLSRGKIVESLKGASGGFIMTEAVRKSVRLVDIVNAIDGEDIYEGCALGLKKCSEEKPCPLHYKFKSIRLELRKMLEATTVQELSERMDQPYMYLKI